ncbi:MAG TPA: ABC transporter permease [Chloroflexota bacterium]|nr:ABC transporter permease [Chloroflexota bacterium]
MATNLSMTPFLIEEEVWSEQCQQGLWTQAFRRLSQNKAAMVSLIVICLLYLVAIFSPLIAPTDPTQVHFANILTPPAWQPGGTWEFPLGTDSVGRDLLSRLIYGARISMSIGLVPVVFYLVIGGTVGLIAGYAGGVVDTVLMRGVDVFYALPDLLIMITLVTLLRETALGDLLSGLVIILAALALFGWVGTARLVRGQVLAYKEISFVEAARALGASPMRIIFRHIVPQILAPIIVQMTFTIPGAITAEAVLSFIGIGVRPPTASWGNMVQDGMSALFTRPMLAIAPAFCIAIVTLAFTFLGDGLRDALDPHFLAQPSSNPSTPLTGSGTLRPRTDTGR